MVRDGVRVAGLRKGEGLTEGSHFAGVDRAVGFETVPALPGGCAVHDYRIEPGGNLGLEYHAVEVVCGADLGES